MAPNVAYHMQPATSFHPYPAQYYTTTPTIPQQPMTAIAEQGGKMGETPASDLNLKESTDNNCSSSQPSEPPPALVGEAPLSANNMQSHQPGQGLQQGQVQAQVYPHNIQPTSLPNAFAQHFQQQQQHNQVYAIGMTTPLVTPPAAPMQAPLSPTSDEALNDANKKKKKGVPHVYHDYSSVQDQLGYVRKKTGGVTQPFPEKLMEMLTAEANNQTLCGWLPHGRAFIVRKPKQFTQEIMPKYFRQSKLTSFQRQLNLYGFRRITQGADAGAYYHELFLRGRPQLCMRMNRQKVKGTGHKQPADAQSEPNFYTMPAPTQTNPGYVPPQDPGLQGLQGAADLLKGFAAGIPVSSVSGATWPTTAQMAGPAPSVTQQYVYAAPAGSQQPQMIYTQGPNGLQQIMYAPAPGQASLIMGADGQFYFTTAPTPYAAPAPYAMTAPAPYAMTSPAPVSGEQQQQQQSYSHVTPAPSMMTYAPAPADGTPSSYNPTVQFVWPPQQQHSGQQAWIQQAQQIQQIAQPTMQAQQQAPDQVSQSQVQQYQQQVPQPQVQQYQQQQQQHVPKAEQQQDQQLVYAQQPAVAQTSASST